MFCVSGCMCCLFTASDSSVLYVHTKGVSEAHTLTEEQAILELYNPHSVQVRKGSHCLCKSRYPIPPNSSLSSTPLLLTTFCYPSSLPPLSFPPSPSSPLQTLEEAIEQYPALVNCSSMNNEAPIHTIVKMKRKDKLSLLVTLLTNSNADVNIETRSSGFSPLHQAVLVSECYLDHYSHMTCILKSHDLHTRVT